MLSEREQQAISEIERHIAAEDPRFVASMRRLSPPRTGPRTRRLHTAVILVAAVSAALCFALAAGGAGVVATLLAIVFHHLRRCGDDPRPRRPSRRRPWRPLRPR